MKKLTLLSIFLIAGIYAQSQIITTVAGNGYGVPLSGGYTGDGHQADSAELYQPAGIAIDKSGNIYIADEYNNVIRKVTKSTGIITTIVGNGKKGFKGDGGLADSAELNYPFGIALDDSGNIFFSDQGNYRIRKVTKSNGIITTIAGNGINGYKGIGGLADSAEMFSPYGITLDNSGNIYFADFSNVNGNGIIGKITVATGIITTVAGDTGTVSMANGIPATTKDLGLPRGVAIDDSGNIYVASSNYGEVLKVFKNTGKIYPVAGNYYLSSQFSGSGIQATATGLTATDVALDDSGNIYIAGGSNFQIYKVYKSTGIIDLIAGTGVEGFSGDGGPATAAQFDSPNAIGLDAAGNIFVADNEGNRIRKITVAGYINGTVYTDNNHNCIFDSGDVVMPYVSLKAYYDSALVETTISDNNGHYLFGSLTQNKRYRIELDSASTPWYSFTCPVSGIDTAIAVSISNIAIKCTQGFDLTGNLSVCIDTPGVSTASITASIYNNRCQPVSGAIKLVLDSAIHITGTMADSMGIKSGDTLIWRYYNIAPNHTSNFSVYLDAKVDSIPAGDSVMVKMIITPIAGDSVPSNNIITYWINPSVQHCFGAPYDPNGKEVSPQGNISATQRLTYTIHFQNTGTAPAHNVVVVDTLSPYVDPTTLSVISSSSPMTTQIIGGHIMKFIFNGINLPDSSVNLIGSTSSFTYSILPMGNVFPGDVVKNRADIFFDSNPGVLTNATTNMIGHPIITTVQNIQPIGRIAAFPNPFSNTTSIVFNTDGKHYLEVDDISGRRLEWAECNGKQYEFSRNDLAQGIYFIKAFDGEQHYIATTKIIVQ